MLEKVLVLAIVVAALAVTLWRGLRKRRPSDGGCAGCGAGRAGGCCGSEGLPVAAPPCDGCGESHRSPGEESR